MTTHLPPIATIDFPAAGSCCDPLSLRVEGWAFGGERHATLRAVATV